MITSQDYGKRIDSLICRKLKNYSRNRLQSLILMGKLKFNEQIIKQPSFKLKNDGIIKLVIPDPVISEITPQNIKINIVYEDNYLIVVNKDPGMVVHPGSGNRENTLVNALLSHCKNNLSGIGGVLRPGVVHRIDKMTSGLLVFAKDDQTHRSLSDQFRRKSTEREYDLLVWNLLPNKEGIINKNISRSKFNRKKMSICDSSSGKSAITNYKLIKTFLINENIKISYLKCQLQTGRTHQIRVHMNYLGNSIVGDDKYKKKFKKIKNINPMLENKIKNLDRQFLHAQTIGFIHPKKNKEMIFNSILPNELRIILKTLRNIGK